MLEGLTFDDVLLKPKRSVLDYRIDADLTGLRLWAAPMSSVSTIQFYREAQRQGVEVVVNRMGLTIVQRVYLFKSLILPAVAIGLDQQEFISLYSSGARTFVLDVAHAHTQRVIDFVKFVKSFDGAWLMAGSVATYEAAIDLANAGADSLRVGIGPGSACTTRKVTGFGVPQLQAIEDCVEADTGLPLVADGGIRGSGDIVKALAAGADEVMLGGLFAYSTEADTNSHYGNASARVNGHRAPEGTEIEILDADKEPLADIVKRLLWGVRSGISYGGARNIKELQENAEWIRLTDAGRAESKLR